VACPLLEGIDLSGARGVLVLIAASKQTFKLAESRNAMNTIRRYAADDAHVIYGTAYDESLSDQLRVTVIATGLSSAVHTGNGTVSPPQHSYENLNTPSVWRNGRSQAAAKADALASNGMDEIEVPAFLRKQAD
jgi:cell division protein FtsZ